MVALMWRLDELRCSRLSLVFLLALLGAVVLVGRPAWANADGVPGATAQGAASAQAQGSAESPDEQLRRAQDLSRTTMSPFCPGRTLDACPSEYATQWRRDIRQWVSEGVPTEEIRNRLRQRTDHDLTGAPSTALDSVLPVLVTVLSLGLLIVLLRVLVRPDTKQGVGKGSSEPGATGSPGNASGQSESAPARAAAEGGTGRAAEGGTGRAARTSGKALDERLDDELRNLDD